MQLMGWGKVREKVVKYAPRVETQQNFIAKSY